MFSKALPDAEQRPGTVRHRGCLGIASGGRGDGDAARPPAATYRPPGTHRACRRLLIPLLAGCLAALHCHSGPLNGAPPVEVRAGLAPASEAAPPQSCSRAYAGELLAYFMKVVLGRCGRPDQREAWRTRALDHPLDLATIAAELDDAGKDKSQLMVLDANMLGYSEVLYHYDPLLNQFRGRYAYHSVYPSPEMIALRMLLLRKLDRHEKIDLKAVLANLDLLLHPSQASDPAVMRRMNLRPDEFRLLSDVLRTDPQIVDYLYNPFLVKSLADIGAVRRDRFVSQIIRRANYREVQAGSGPAPPSKSVATVVILPSMTKEFIACDQPAAPPGQAFAPTGTYRTVTAELQDAIRRKTVERLAKTTPPPEPDRGWESLVRQQVRFIVVDSRPLLVYPQNAEEVLSDICPEADVVLVLMGEDVYRAVDVDPARDVYPHVNRMYLDLGDVRHGDVESELAQVGDIVCRKIKPLLTALSDRRLEVHVTGTPQPKWSRK